MPPTLKALLNKPELTSRDAGLVMMYYAKATLEDKEDTLPINIEDLNAIISSVKYRSDRYRFDALEAFYYAIRNNRERAYENARRLAGGLNLLNLYIRIFGDHSKQDTLLFNLPLTLTKPGHIIYTKAAQAAAAKHKYTFYEIFTEYIFYYLRAYQSHPLTISTKIYEAFSLSESQEITAKSIKKYYGETHRNPLLIDSDNPQGIEFTDDKQLNDYLINSHKDKRKKADNKQDIAEQLRELDRFYFLDDINGMRELIAAYPQFFYNDNDIQAMTDNEIIEFYLNVANDISIYGERPALMSQGKTEEQLPPETTIYSLLEATREDIDKNEKHPNGILFADDTRPHSKQLRELKQSAPLLFETICGLIKDDIPQFKGLTEAELLKAAITGAELNALQNTVMLSRLTDVSYRDLQEYIISSDKFSYMEKRQARNGIATIEATNKHNEIGIIRKHGETMTYKTPVTEIHPTLQEFKELDFSKTFNKEIFTPLKMIFAYNAFIDICTEALNIPFMNRCAKLLEIAPMLMIIKNYNDNLYTTYRNINGSPADKQHRKELFKHIFTQIDTYKANPSKTFKEAVKENLEEAIKKKHGAEWIQCATQIIKDLADNSEEETE